MKPHESWWETNLDTRMGDFGEWLTQSDAASREILYDFVRDRPAIQTVLECGPGLFIDYDRYFARVSEHVAYRAVEVTPRLVALGKQKGINVLLGSIEAIPLPRKSADVVYCRHVLEHLPTYRDAITDMMRVSSCYVICIFWKLDQREPTDRIEYNTVQDVPNVYHNTYSQSAVTEWVWEKFKPLAVEWRGNRDRILIITK